MSGDFDPLRSPDKHRPTSPRGIHFEDDLINLSGQLHPLQSSSSSSTSSSSNTPARADLGPLSPQSQHRSYKAAQKARATSPLPPTSANPSDSNMRDLRDYGATGHRQPSVSDSAPDTPTRAGSRAPGPGRINLPPTPFATPRADRGAPSDDGSDHGDEAGQSGISSFRPRASSMTPSVATSGGNRGPGQRKMSFKRRIPAHPRTNLFQRASMGVFPGRKLSVADSDAGSNWRRIRRVHTASVHPAAEGADDGVWAGDGVPSIPRLLPTTQADPYSNPIPTLPFIVLCLVVFGEFSSAGVAGPFLFFMIEDFGVGGESDVGFWAGIVSAVFFFAQFLTSLMWASVAEKRGRRFVLMVSLIGNAVSLTLFGMSTNLPTAIMIRLAQGFFNGAVGVAKGAIRDITDETNEGRAYAQMGFCWGMGGIIGPILGGVLEHPVKKYPGLFGGSDLFVNYPYLLPCIAAASFTALGAILSLFIGYDGGPRTGAIQLPEKADIERATNQMASNMGSLGRSASKRISGYFSGQTPAASASDLNLSRTNTHQEEPSTPSSQAKLALPRTFTQQVDYETGGPPSPVPSDTTVVTHTNAGDSNIEPRYRPRLFSRTEERQRNILGGGSAYGYDRRFSRSSAAPYGTSIADSRVDSIAYDRNNNRNSIVSTNQYAPDFEEIGDRPGLSFAQRFLLAQDDSVFTISDLWVAAAINGDDAYEDVFEDDEDLDEEAYMDGDDSIAEESFEDSIDEEDEDDDGHRHRATEGSPLLAPKHLPPLNFAQRKLSRSGALSDAGRSHSSSRPLSLRRPSNGRIPSLYANTGIETPLLSPGNNPLSPGASMMGPLGGAATQAIRAEGAWDPTLQGIPESHSNRNSLAGGSSSPDRRSVAQSAAGRASVTAVQTSLFTLLPVTIIAHYGLMAFHSSTFDQVFMAFLVTPEPSGGLGLTASHYAQLISAMACCQLVFQFVFYPKVGPPQGNLSHLAMLRLGTAIYLPCYTLFPLLRGLLHPDTDGFVMSGMILFASMRWLANVCAFTAVSVLINAMTPPHLTPLANGLAQTTSSAARFVGPIIGGLVWARGIEGGPDAHSWPFNYHIGFWFVGLAAFTGFLFTWRIK